MRSTISRNIWLMTNLKLIPLLFILALTLASGAVSARELTDMNLQISSDRQGAEAKQDAFDKATAEATLKLTEEILGAERAAKYWPSLKPKLLKTSARYVVFIKGSTPEISGGLTRTNVQLRLSGDALEALLREEGLLNTGTVRVLPLVQVSEQIDGRRFVWWADKGDDERGSTVIPGSFKKVIQLLTTKFKARNAYVMDPLNQSFRLSVPSTYRSEVLRREDQALLAQYLKADVVLTGIIFIDRPQPESKEARLVFDLQLWQTKSGREVAIIQRSETLSSENSKTVNLAIDQIGAQVMEELSAKLGEVIAAGTLNLNILKLSVNGNMDYHQQAEFRKAVAQLREIKALKERLFEPSRVIYELETSISGQEMAKIIMQSKFSSFSVQIEDTQDASLSLQVRPGPSAFSR